MPAVPVAVTHVDLLVHAVQHRLLDLGRQPPPRDVHPEADGLRERLEQAGEVLGALPGGPGGDRAVDQRPLLVGDHQFRVDLLADADAGARRAGPVGRVEGEGTGFEVIHGKGVPVGAGHPLREPALPVRVVRRAVDEVQHHEPVGQAQGGLHRVGEPLLRGGLHRQPVDDDLDVVLLLLLQRRWVGQRVHDPVDADPGVTLGGQLREQVDVLALAAPDDGREHLEPGALLQVEHLVHDLLRRLPADRRTAGRAVRLAGARVEQPEVVVDLGDGADRGTGVPARGLLVDGHRGGEALDEVHVRLVHLPQELAGVGGQ